LSLFEEKQKDFIRQIDAYLDILKEQSLLTSEASSNFRQLQSTGNVREAFQQNKSAESLKQL